MNDEKAFLYFQPDTISFLLKNILENNYIFSLVM